VQIVIKSEQHRTVPGRGRFRQDAGIETELPHRLVDHELLHSDLLLRYFDGVGPSSARRSVRASVEAWPMTTSPRTKAEAAVATEPICTISLPLLGAPKHQRQDLAGTVHWVGAGLAAPGDAKDSAGAAFGELGWVSTMAVRGGR